MKSIIMLFSFILCFNAFSSDHTPEEKQLLKKGFKNTIHCEDGDGDEWFEVNVYQKNEKMEVLVVHHTDNENNDILTIAKSKGVVTKYEGHTITTGWGSAVSSLLEVTSDAASFIVYQGNIGQYCDILKSSSDYFYEATNQFDEDYLMDGFLY